MATQEGLPRTTPSARGEKELFGQVLAEMRRQEQQWGVQDYPSVDPILANREGGCSPERMTSEYELPTELRAKWMTHRAAQDGVLTWAHVVVEELVEAISCIHEGPEMRTELVQTTAVLFHWVQALDRRAAERAGLTQFLAAGETGHEKTQETGSGALPASLQVLGRVSGPAGAQRPAGASEGEGDC